MQLYVGCAQWTHAAWPQPSRDKLRSYASWCNAVESNTTFYATPSASTVASWAAQTPPDFRFVVKLPQVITHERRLNNVDAELRAFLAAIEPLGPRNHAVWIQLPAAFAPTDLGALAAFLHQAPREHRYAVEVRHRDFFDDPRAAGNLERVLARANAEWIPFDTGTLFARRPTSLAERDAWMKKPRVARRTRALTGNPIVRYIGRDSVDETVAGVLQTRGGITRRLRDSDRADEYPHIGWGCRLSTVPKWPADLGGDLRMFSADFTTREDISWSIRPVRRPPQPRTHHSTRHRPRQRPKPRRRRKLPRRRKPQRRHGLSGGLAPTG
jgi:uncharacterized protein YecE (DUF72 family)